MNRWTKALNTFLNRASERVPEGWLTSEQVGKEWGVNSQRNTNNRLAKLRKAGLVECKMFKLSDGKQLRPIRHYRLLC